MSCESSGSARLQTTRAAPRERPVLFTGEMVRAILAGRKTQTRRVVKPQPPADAQSVRRPGGLSLFWRERPHVKGMPFTADSSVDCPYRVGGPLWVRETWADLRGMGFQEPVAYRADCLDKDGREDADSERCREDYAVKWKPSIFMPRAACRILLEVTGIRVQRIQDITEEDCAAEGTVPYRAKPLGPMLTGTRSGPWPTYNAAVEAFARLWNSVNASPKPVYRDKVIDHYVSYPWDGEREVREHRRRPWYVVPNPWVWVVEFRRLP